MLEDINDLFNDCLNCFQEEKKCIKRPPGRYKIAIDEKSLRYGYKNAMEYYSKEVKNENFIFALCTFSGTPLRQSDYLATIDANPSSKEYSKVINRLQMPYVCDEVFCMSWNVPSSHLKDKTLTRTCLIIGCFNSARIYVVKAPLPPDKPEVLKVIHYSEVFQKVNLSMLTTVRCFQDGEIFISAMGDKHGESNGGILVLDNKNFNVKHHWAKKADEEDMTPFDFSYNNANKTLITAELCSPSLFKEGYTDNLKRQTTNSVILWDLETRKQKTKIDLSTKNGFLPMVVRFLHKPTETDAYIACANGIVLKISDNNNVDAVITILPKNVENWQSHELPAIITDMCFSFDDKFMYLCTYLQGEVRQYDLRKRSRQKTFPLLSKIQLGGLLCDGEGVSIMNSSNKMPPRTKVKGVVVGGAPSRLKLSMDGTRLYVSNSYVSMWDNQTYPKLSTEGCFLLQLTVNAAKGGLSLNKDFAVNFGGEPDGAVLLREIKFAEADPTSDIFQHY